MRVAIALGLALLLLGAAPARPAAPIDRVYCNSKGKPKGCIKVPGAAKRPPKVDQQGARSLTPTDVVNGGGLGAGPGQARSTAVEWARSQLGLSIWAYRCQRFAEEAFGTRFEFDSAAAAAAKLKPKGKAPRKAPAGTLMYFRADKINRGYGHVGLSLGDGRMISALDKVRIVRVDRSPYWKRLYRGWTDAPKTWPGRIPPPPGPSGPLVSSAVQITAPAFGSKLAGTVQLAAAAVAVAGVAFDAYYATDPTDRRTLGWHPLGRARDDSSTWTLDWDTTTVPNQGNSSWGAINVAATAIDARGRRTGTRDYRRVAVDNANSSIVPTPTPTPTPTATPTSTPTPTPGPPTVSIRKGASAQGRPGCSSSSCRFVDVTFSNFSGGSHVITHRASNGDEGGWYTLTRSGSAGSVATGYYGWAGRSVWVTVDGVASNTIVW